MDGLYNRTIVRSVTDGSEVARTDYSLPGAIHESSVAVAVHRDGRLRPPRSGSRARAGAPRRRHAGDVVPTDRSPDGRTILLFQLDQPAAGSSSTTRSRAPRPSCIKPAGTPDPYGDPFLIGDEAAGVVWSDAEHPLSLIRLDRESSTTPSVSEHERYPGAA